MVDFCDITILLHDPNDAHGPTSLVNHAICSRDMHNLIKHDSILDKPPSSDHLLLSTVFNICL